MLSPPSSFSRVEIGVEYSSGSFVTIPSYKELHSSRPQVLKLQAHTPKLQFPLTVSLSNYIEKILRLETVIPCSTQLYFNHCPEH